MKRSSGDVQAPGGLTLQAPERGSLLARIRQFSHGETARSKEGKGAVSRRCWAAFRRASGRGRARAGGDPRFDSPRTVTRSGLEAPRGGASTRIRDRIDSAPARGSTPCSRAAFKYYRFLPPSRRPRSRKPVKPGVLLIVLGGLARSGSMLAFARPQRDFRAILPRNLANRGSILCSPRVGQRHERGRGGGRIQR
jgi:hypothetical protein